MPGGATLLMATEMQLSLPRRAPVAGRPVYRGHMKPAVVFLTALTAGAAVTGAAQSTYPAAPVPYPSAPPPNAAAPNPYPPAANSSEFAGQGAFNPQQLSQLLSPVALYPDPLLGAILPASTHPDQVAAAANFVADNNNPGGIDAQPWDDSVKVLAHYPDVVAWMAQNPDWTSQLGAAVTNQQPEVMDVIQQLRANARADGALVDTPQQRVLVQDGMISIVPAQPNTVYVPDYNPQYLESGVPAGGSFALQFGPAYPLAGWATFGLDWRNHSVWFDRGRPEEEGHEGGRMAQVPSRQFWHPNGEGREGRPFEANRRVRPQAVTPTPRIAHPAPFAGRRDWRQQPMRAPGLQPTGRPNGRMFERGRSAPERARPDNGRVQDQRGHPADQQHGRDHDDRDRGDRRGD